MEQPPSADRRDEKTPHRAGGSRRELPLHALIVSTPATSSRAVRIGELLREMGHRVHQAEAAAAWDLLKREWPQLVVLASLAPEPLALCRRIRRTASYERVLVLAVADPEAEELKEAVEAGVDDCVPADAPETFMRACLALIERRIRNRMQWRQIEHALRESEARVRAIVETTVDGIVTIDEQGTIESFNQAAEKIFGYTAEEAIGQNVEILMPQPYRDEHSNYIQSYLETGHRKIIGIGREVVGRRKDGSVFPMDLAVSEIRLGQRRIFTGFVRDVTERRRLEQEILRISDEERRRIGQDLHDGLGQMLTGTGLIAQSLARRLEAKGLPAAAEVAEIAELIKEADQYARGLSRGLVPVDLAASGLRSALQRLGRNAEQLFGIRCTFEEAGTPLVRDNTVATHLYRITQEAVSNAVKHGRAQHVKIMLAGGNGQLRLRVHDDGVGFPEELDEATRGMGVHIMHYRARIIGANLEITGSADGGTTITCTLHKPDAPMPMGGEEYGHSL